MGGQIHHAVFDDRIHDALSLTVTNGQLNAQLLQSLSCFTHN